STAAMPDFSLQPLLRDAVLPLVPVDDDILDERRGRHPEIADGGHETARATLRTTTAERVPARFARIRTVKVRRGPQHRNAVEIHQPGDGPAAEGHVGGVILLLRGAIGPFAARPQR